MTTRRPSATTGFLRRLLGVVTACAVPVGVAVGCNTAELQVPPVDPPETFDASRDASHPADAADAALAPDDGPASMPEAGADARDAGPTDASDAQADAVADAKLDG